MTKAMKRQNTSMQPQSNHPRLSKWRRAPRAGRSAYERPSLPRDFDDWLEAERDHLVEQVLLSWLQPNVPILESSEPGFSAK
jgi:hypothetical protein